MENVMNEDKTYEPKKIEIEVGEHPTPLTIANGIILFLTEWRGTTLLS